MTTKWFLLTAACFFVKANSVENIYSDNGWRPTSNEKVFELQRNFIKTPLSVQMRIVQGNPMDNIFQRMKAIKIVQPNHLNKESIKADEAIFSFRKENERNGRSFEDPNHKHGTSAPYRQGLKTQNNFESTELRRSKDMENIKTAFNNFTSDEIEYINEMQYEDVSKKGIVKKMNTYEVKEILEEDLFDQQVKPRHSNVHEIEEPRASINNQALIPVNNLYKFGRSDFETNSRKNLTSTLFNILANYNIRTGDKLPNYALSLRQNSRNFDNNDFLYMHVPLKIPLRYNSQNHFPIDPLLAVFLSNYGHYLPGLYGFQRSYNNLYGYLASNNIHNNRPFGSYKVFSDTDSSH